MVANGAAARTHHRFQAFIIFHQQIPGGRSRENLDGADIGLQFQRRKFRDIRLGATDINPDIAPGMALHEFALCIQPFGIGDGRRGIRHVKHCRQATQHRGARAGFHGFHLGVARVTQMHMRVNQTRQQMKPLAIHHLSRFGLGQVTNGGDAPGADANIGTLHPPWHHTVSALQGKVKTRHRSILRVRLRYFALTRRGEKITRPNQAAAPASPPPLHRHGRYGTAWLPHNSVRPIAAPAAGLKRQSRKAAPVPDGPRH